MDTQALGAQIDTPKLICPATFCSSPQVCMATPALFSPFPAVLLPL